MAEEQGGLSYTIRFIPDTTAIDESITEIAKRVENEVGQAIRKARVAAGVEEGVPTGAAPIEGVGVVDRIISEFRSVKERITGMMQKYGILAGETMALGHPTGRTLGGVMERLREKLAVTRPEDLSEDMRLLIAGAMSVVTQRIEAMQELRPDLSKEEATKMVMQEKVGELKGIDVKGMFKQYQTMRQLAEVMRLADYYKDTLAGVSERAPKSVERALMMSLTHKFIAAVGKAKLEAEGGVPDWEHEEVTWRAVYRRLGATEEQVKEWGIPERIRAADLFRIVDGKIEIVEFGGGKTGKEASRDIGMGWKLFDRIKETPLMAETVKEITGLSIEDISLETILATAGIFGSTRAVVEAEAAGRPGMESTVTDLGNMMRAAIEGLIPDLVGGTEQTTEILNGIHKILESLGQLPTQPAWPNEPVKGPPDLSDDAYDESRRSD